MNRLNKGRISALLKEALCEATVDLFVFVIDPFESNIFKMYNVNYSNVILINFEHDKKDRTIDVPDIELVP